MDELKKDLQLVFASLSADEPLTNLLGRFFDALNRHTDALGEVAGRYRLKTTDTGISFAFEAGANILRMLGENDRVDAALSASEADLIALIRRELKPVAALFAGRLRPEGSKALLTRFSQLF